MAKNELINVIYAGKEVGRVGFDEDKKKSSFQFNPDFLESGAYTALIPATGIVKRISHAQVFSKYSSKTFRGMPPFIADSLPDAFGNLIFKKWLESSNKQLKQISVIEQLAYVANRGMGALEYSPSKKIPRVATIDIAEITAVLKEVLENKHKTESIGLNNDALLNIFKIGTSAGGARPKILVSEHRNSKRLIPGDINSSADYNHYLVKLGLDDNEEYRPEVVEFSYYQTAIDIGIDMMPSKLIDYKHFATERFDRVNGIKNHSLTATGLTGWDFMDPEVSSYENLFDLAVFLKVPHKDLEQLFRRMIFNLEFKNIDDHLKNHSFSYTPESDSWRLSPAYDLTFPINPLRNYTRLSRALSIKGKRSDIKEKDMLWMADQYTIKNPKGIISEVRNAQESWEKKAMELTISKSVISSIKSHFKA